MLKKIKESKLKLIRNSSKKTEKNFNRKQKPKTKNNTGQIIGESKLSKLISLWSKFESKLPTIKTA